MAWASCQIRKIPGYAFARNAGNVFPATADKRSRHASRHVHHARAAMHDGIANWRLSLKSVAGETFQHSRRLRNPQFYVSGTRPMASHCLIIMTQAIEVYRRHPFKDIVMEIYSAIFFSTIRILLTCAPRRSIVLQFFWHGDTRPISPFLFFFNSTFYLCIIIVIFTWCIWYINWSCWQSYITLSVLMFNWYRQKFFIFIVRYQSALS